MHRVRLAVVTCCLSSVACANAITRPAVAPSKPASDALLVLPGFGYSRAGEHAFRALAPALAADGVDLYLPTFVSRSGLDESRELLRGYIRKNGLGRYARVHVFAFIAGGWTFNPLAETGVLPNLSTVVYDRSPDSQERATRDCAGEAPFLNWLRYGPVPCSTWPEPATRRSPSRRTKRRAAGRNRADLVHPAIREGRGTPGPV